MTAGKAITKENTHALSQIDTISSTKPTLNTLIINDIKQDINNAIKKAKMKFWYFLFII